MNDDQKNIFNDVIEASEKGINKVFLLMGQEEPEKLSFITH